jgi:hypothetical protein
MVDMANLVGTDANHVKQVTSSAVAKTSMNLTGTLWTANILESNNTFPAKKEVGMFFGLSAVVYVVSLFFSPHKWEFLQEENQQRPRLPDFSRCNIPKQGKIYQTNTKYTKRP